MIKILRTFRLSEIEVPRKSMFMDADSDQNKFNVYEKEKTSRGRSLSLQMFFQCSPKGLILTKKRLNTGVFL